MKRDWDFIREILIDLEENSNLLKKHQDTETEEKFLYHIRLLVEEGLVLGIQANQGVGGGWVYSSSNPRLGWAGHEILDTLRSQTVWEKIKARSKETSIELTTESVKALGAWALKALIGDN